MKHLRIATAQRAAIADALSDIRAPSTNSAAPQKLLERCPAAQRTPMHQSIELAKKSGVAELWIKDERARMNLGSFKALGAAYVIACDAESGTAKGQTYVTASAGNHGLSVAAGADAFGARAIIYLADTVPESFADRLRAFGAQVERAGAIYEDAMARAARDAEANGWTLLSDSSWPGYTERPHRLMEGYTVLMAEVVAQMPAPPTHIYLQAGVGGLAAACAAMARDAWGDAAEITVVEPEVAPALFVSIEEGKAAVTEGAASDMGRLDCKEPSLIALKGLAQDADAFCLISEAEGHEGAEACAQAGFETTPSGAGGFSGLLSASGDAHPGPDARVLVILSEGS